jgi:glucosylceramidase
MIIHHLLIDCNYPKCDWTGVQLRDFIKLYAGPQFEKDHPNTTKMWLGTLNTDDFLECPNTVSPFCLNPFQHS